jgi:hypothetical protein
MATPNIVPNASGEGGLGTAVLGWGGTFITNTTTSSATQGGKLVLAADDGAVMATGHRLGVVEFSGAEDASNTISVGAKIEALAADTFAASENGSNLLFYTTNATTQSEVLKLDNDKAATFAGSIIATKPSVTNLAGNGSIPITAAFANIDANGSARTGIRFAGAGTAGQIIYVNNTGGETLTFHPTAGTCLVRGMTTSLDTMEPTGVYHFISDGARWNFIGGGTSPGEGLTAS